MIENTSISSRAMLVDLSISIPAFRKLDKRITEQVASQNGTADSVGRYTKTILAKSAMEGFTKAAGAARQFHYELTLPWAKDGPRILSIDAYDAYTKGIEKLRRDFERTRDEFLDNYLYFVQEARWALNGLFNPADYPERAVIEGRFNFDMAVYPMPDADDFRIKLGDFEVNRIKADIQARQDAAVQGAIADVWRRIHDRVSHMADRLRAYQTDPETGKVLSTFRDSLVVTMRELVATLPHLNFSNDPKLEDMRKRLDDELATYDADALREDAVLRDQTAANAEKILADMSVFLI